MVNQDFEKFNKIQQKHKSPHLGGAQSKEERSHDTDGNANSGISAGAEGREITSRGE